ncbi:MAG: trypsin-like peptidase domain-containing protein, partial [Gammaproteobacteria bacterium]|nr:trypsin-like peptidase domain-containing protein [Gammaproteobacteria bacterium]
MKKGVHSLFFALTVLILGLASFESQAFSGKLPDFTELVAENSPAVVNISTLQKQKRVGSIKIPDNIPLPELPEGNPFEDLLKKYFGHPDIGNGEQPDSEAQSLGSGFIIDEDGYILTNNHVVDDAEEIIVRLSDRRELQAKVVGTDKQSDIALLKIDADHLPVVKLGKSEDLKVGEWVMAIGSPFGFDHSVSVGVVSALGRSLPSENYVPYIQTDVAINPGNSGGPLFNLDGEVVGINSQIYSRTGGFMGLSFAIPVSVALDVAKQLKEQGHVTRGWLGVLIQDVTRELAESFGMDRPEGALIA